MLSSPELIRKNSEVLTNEISVQVESQDLNLYSRQKSHLLKFSSNRRFEFISLKEPEQSNQKLLSKNKSKLNKISSLSNRIPTSFSNKPDNKDSKVNMSPYFNAPKEIKIKNIQFEKVTSLQKLKSNKNLSEIPLKDPLFTNVKLAKCPSAYQIPHVFDPMDNFVTTNVPAKLSKYKLKPKPFKPSQFSIKPKINLKSKSSSSRPSLPVQKNAKFRAYFKHIPRVHSLNLN